PGVNTFGVTGGGASIAKLGFSAAQSLLSNVKDALRKLGDLSVSLASPITSAVKFEGGMPKLRLDVDYRANRSTPFSYDLGDQAMSAGLAFDVAARLNVDAALVFDFALGL